MLPQSPYCQTCLDRKLVRTMIEWLASDVPEEQTSLFHQMREQAAEYRRVLDEGQRMGFVSCDNGGRRDRVEGES